jgi:hypothetical protein
MDMDMYCRYSMDRTCSMDMDTQYGPEHTALTLTFNMDMDMQHGHGYGHAAWISTCPCCMFKYVQKGHGHAAWTGACSMDMDNSIDPLNM